MITSLKSPKIKHIRRLFSSRRARQRYGEFFVEGVQAISAAYHNGWDIRNLVYCPNRIRSDWAREILAKTDQHVHLQVSEYVQDQLSDRDSPSELMAVVAKCSDDLGRIDIGSGLLVLILDRPRNPGNLGSTIRSADALGAWGVIITGHAVDLYDPVTVRASVGCLFNIPVIQVDQHQTLENWLGRVRRKLHKLQVIATSAHASEMIYNRDLTVPTVFVVGNEKLGISRYFQSTCDTVVAIPMSGSPSSFNVSVAASIVLYEATRQRSQHL
jgi:tRNA G18 (ribose-2'-O)-methylase SpoU